jgi:putative addiction module component (TIGR02574 family)
MSPQLIQCENEALKLSPADRAELARHLIASLDHLSDEQHERLWVDEANRRYQDYKSGAIMARAAEDVLCAARDMIK